jgi:hypothetical protein
MFLARLHTILHHSMDTAIPFSHLGNRFSGPCSSDRYSDHQNSASAALYNWDHPPNVHIQTPAQFEVSYQVPKRFPAPIPAHAISDLMEIATNPKPHHSIPAFRFVFLLLLLLPWAVASALEAARNSDRPLGEHIASVVELASAVVVERHQPGRSMQDELSGAASIPSF